MVGPGTFKTNLSYFENGSNVIEGADADSSPATIIEPLDATKPIFDADRADFTLQDVTIDGLGDGDALTSDYGSDIDVIDSTVTDAAIAACACGPTGTITLNDSTISGNTVGITQDDPAADVDVVATTIAGNSTGLVGYSNIALAGSVVADNTTTDCSLSALSGLTADYEYDLDDDGTCGFSAANHSQSDVVAGLGPLRSNGGPTETMAPSRGSPLLNQIPAGTPLLCSGTGTDQRGVTRPQGAGCDIGAMELAVASSRSITSADSATSTAGQPFSFTAMTVGHPVPSLSEKGKLPKHVTFVDNHNGSATISGTATKVGRYHLKITATFGTGKTKNFVTQTFTLTVTPG
jgi:hypothetical protein